ncbi:hypothetical protein DOY81_009550 [Sarcophaga bullata]|nr:hypothetical protein DOY81_009550 [Sarcophaga bullata]
MDMLMVGVDTTSSTFTSLLLCLAENPIKQAKLREEILQVLPLKDSEFTEESLKHMLYLKSCLKEALRYYPIVDRYIRRLANDVTLSGYRIPKGTRIIMAATDLLRDENHFHRANDYLPERWLRSADLPNLRSKCPFVYLPFGFGPRTCIGRRIAELEIELCIARIIRNFHVEFNYPNEKPFKSLLMNVPNMPLKFKFTDVNH